MYNLIGLLLLKKIKLLYNILVKLKYNGKFVYSLEVLFMSIDI